MIMIERRAKVNNNNNNIMRTKIQNTKLQIQRYECKAVDTSYSKRGLGERGFNSRTETPLKINGNVLHAHSYTHTLWHSKWKFK